jgi:hypothetical protein
MIGSLAEFSEQSGGMLAELAVVGTKGGEKMGVDVEFAGNFTVDETGTTISDLVSREQAGRVGSNVVNDNGFTCRRSRPADALIEWDAGVRRHGAVEGASRSCLLVSAAPQKKTAFRIGKSSTGSQLTGNAASQDRAAVASANSRRSNLSQGSCADGERNTNATTIWHWIGFPSYVAALKFQFFKAPVADAVSGGMSRRGATLAAFPFVSSVTFRTTAPWAFALAG